MIIHMNNPIADRLEEFSKNFLQEANGPYHATENTRIITETVPTMLRDALEIGDGYKLYGSIGSGGWVEIPWIAILDKSISESTRDGYYVAVIFSKDIQYFYLCLMAGWTQFKDEYGTKDGRANIRIVCDHYAKLLESKPVGFSDGVMNLGAEIELGKGYELGAIVSKKYQIGLINDSELLNDLRGILSTYSELKSIVGNSILNIEVEPTIDTETVATFKQRIAAESFSTKPLDSIIVLMKEASASPPEVRTRLIREIVRNRNFATYIKQRASYICQICGRKPFIQKNGQPYAEADHINPLGGAYKGIDGPNNMRCLCAQCHSVVTHGSDEAIAELFQRGDTTNH